MNEKTFKNYIKRKLKENNTNIIIFDTDIMSKVYPGFPDLILLKYNKIKFLELKVIKKECIIFDYFFCYLSSTQSAFIKNYNLPYLFLIKFSNYYLLFIYTNKDKPYLIKNNNIEYIIENIIKELEK